MRKALQNPDPVAAFFGLVLVLCGTFGVAELLAITSDDLAIALGSLGTFAASLRHWLRPKRRTPNSPTFLVGTQPSTITPEDPEA